MLHDNLVNAAMGRIPFDLVIVNANLVNVFTGEIHPASIGIKDGHIAYVDWESRELSARQYMDAEGRYAIPGLVDAHMHIESSMVTPAAFAEGVLPHGTTVVAADPHEIANVLGVDGVKMLLDASRNLPLKVYMMIPSTVPSLPGMESSGAEIGPEEVAMMLEFPGIIGLGEVMDFWGVINLDEKITGVIDQVRRRGGLIEGHSPVFSGKELQAFIAAGVDSDHTIMDEEKVKEKLRLGMNVQIQERFITPELMQYINTLPDPSNFILVTDDVTADRLMTKGHLDFLIKKAIKCGLDPVLAIQATTIRPARRLRLFKHGCIGPGRVADILLLSSLEDFVVDTVIADGEVVAQSGNMVKSIEYPKFPQKAYDTVKLSKLSPEDFIIKTRRQHGIATVNAVAVNDINSRTSLEQVDVPIHEGQLDIKALGLSTMAVFERHGKTGTKNLGFIKNLGDFKGAMATTYAHDCHNLVVIGTNAADMTLAANTLIRAGGGMAAVKDGKILSLVELPIAGLLSDKKMKDVVEDVISFAATLKQMGIRHREPVMLLTILALAVSPEVKITDLGMVDVANKKFIELIVAEK